MQPPPLGTQHSRGALFIDLPDSVAFPDSIYLLLSKSLHVPFHLRQLSSVNQHGEQIHAKVLLTSRVKPGWIQLANHEKGMNLRSIIFGQKNNIFDNSTILLPSS